jgi:hypothetical protein
MESHAEPTYRATYGDAEFRALLAAIFAPGQEWAERLPRVQACVDALRAATAQGTFRHATPMAKHKAPYLHAVALVAVQIIRPNKIGPDEYARLHALLSWPGYRSTTLPSLGYRSTTLPSLAGAGSKPVEQSREVATVPNYLVPQSVDPNLLFPGNQSLKKANPSEYVAQSASSFASADPTLYLPGNRSGPRDDPSVMPWVHLAEPAKKPPTEQDLFEMKYKPSEFDFSNGMGFEDMARQAEAMRQRAAENARLYAEAASQQVAGFAAAGRQQAVEAAEAARQQMTYFAKVGKEQAMAIAAAARRRVLAENKADPGFTVMQSSDPFARPGTTSPLDDPLQAAASAFPGAGALAAYAPMLAGAALLGGVTYAAYRLMSSRSTPEAVQMRDALARSTIDAAFEQLRAWPKEPQAVRIPAFLDLLQEQAWHTEAMDALLQVTGVALLPEVHLVFTRPRGAPRPVVE